jgi:hypothetical protein
LALVHVSEADEGGDGDGGGAAAAQVAAEVPGPVRPAAAAAGAADPQPRDRLPQGEQTRLPARCAPPSLFSATLGGRAPASSSLLTCPPFKNTSRI